MIEYKNKSIFTQYVLYTHAFLQKYLNEWKKTVQKDTPIMFLQEAIVNMIEVNDQCLEDTTWTTIEYKNKSICTQYVLYAHAFLQKYLNKWKKTVQKDTPIMVLQEAIVNMIEVDEQRLEDTTWTTIKYKNNSICTQYVLNAHVLLQKYLNKW